MRLLKWIFVPILTIILIIGVLLTTLYFLVLNPNYDIPYELYKPEVTLNNEVENYKQKISKELKLHGKDLLFLAGEKDDINRLIYAYIKENVNKNYDVNSEDENIKNVVSKQFEVPVLGKLNFSLKGAYVDFSKDDIISLVAPGTVAGIGTVIKANFKFKETPEGFKIVFEKLYFGHMKFNLNKMLKMAEKFGLDTSELSKTINDTLKSMNLPLVFEKEDFSFNFKRELFIERIKKSIDSNTSEDPEIKAFFKDMVDILFDNDLKILKLGVYQNRYVGIKFNLSSFKVNENRLIDSTILSNFNNKEFIKVQSQSFLLNALSETSGNSHLCLSDEQFNQIIYKATNGYSEFKYTLKIMGQDFKISILGITFNFLETKAKVRVDLDLNGLKTIIVMPLEVLNNESNKIVLKSVEKIKFGFDPLDENKKYISVNSNILFHVLEKSLSKYSKIVELDKDSKTFKLSGDNLIEIFLEGSNANVVPVDVTKVIIGKHMITSYVVFNPATPFGALTLSALNQFKLLFNSDLVDLTKFNLTDNNQKELVLKLQSEVKDIGRDIANGVVPQKAIEAIKTLSQLSEENKRVFTKTFEMYADDKPKIKTFLNTFIVPN